MDSSCDSASRQITRRFSFPHDNVKHSHVLNSSLVFDGSFETDYAGGERLLIKDHDAAAARTTEMLPQRSGSRYIARDVRDVSLWEVEKKWWLVLYSLSVGAVVVLLFSRFCYNDHY